jgi:hypothetical protein
MPLLGVGAVFEKPRLDARVTVKNTHQLRAAVTAETDHAGANGR